MVFCGWCGGALAAKCLSYGKVDHRYGVVVARLGGCCDTWDFFGAEWRHGLLSNSLFFIKPMSSRLHGIIRGICAFLVGKFAHLGLKRGLRLKTLGTS